MTNQFSRIQTQHGLTLVELMVAMTIGLFMMIALAVVYNASKVGFVYANNTVRMSEDASFALDMLSRDIRMASYSGCTGSAVVSDGAPTPTLTYTPNLDLIRNQAVTGTAKPNPYSGVIAGDLLQVYSARNAVMGFAANDSAALGVLGGSASSYTPSTTSPMLYVAGGSSQALQVNSAVATVSADITIAADTYKWANNTTLPFMIISDCKGSEVFRATTITASGGIFNIAHTTTTNDANNLFNTYGSDAVVTTLNTSVYFLAKRSGATTSSLYRRYFNGSVAQFEEIVPNVEAVIFQYGVNTSNTPGGEPTYRTDQYQTDPTAVADWSRVVSVRVALIMVSEDDNQTAATSQNLSWVGGTYVSPSDKRLRRAYSTTVSIRNRMGL